MRHQQYTKAEKSFERLAKFFRFWNKGPRKQKIYFKTFTGQQTTMPKIKRLSDQKFLSDLKFWTIYIGWGRHTAQASMIRPGISLKATPYLSIEI